MSGEHHQDIRIGTLASFNKGTDYLAQILPHGFESFELNCWQTLEGLDLTEFSKKVNELLAGQAIVSSLGCYGNPIRDEATRNEFKTIIESAKLFGANVVCGFTGCLEDRSVADNMPEFKKVWSELAKLADDNGVKIAFENCDMGGNWAKPAWNLAHAPRAWEMMFDAVPGDTIGLEWEPCHQMYSLVDPIPQLRKYVDRVYHVHGKDATINWDIIKTHGIRSDQPLVYHRTPGFGDSNWSDIITILRLGGFTGAIDIEGWHDPIYKDELEMTGQVHGLNYLKTCRGGPFVANPK